MSRTRRTVIVEKKKDHDIHPHQKPIRCDNCGEMFPPDEVLMDRDDKGRPLGRFCEGCL
jgi:hypothetical protein